ncbi:class II fructose-bisphosphate aldolase [Siculibacillus lacustris]|uniref:Class II fructose-bisphosphate aldolase n=1 Tax=Siculibacillus lacustris TaxID=1549641 RepID=A0A4Q9VW53_9HYPH|nr:class II fructose-bisphosphate aldolase [Siculibacillus lacustris]TBW40053.1 class II fructose-bisphosphate aldolase [Siculibacillus lacustris]
MKASFAEMLATARREHYAVGSFNVYGYETIRGVIETSRDLGQPAIVAFGAGYLPNMELDEVAGLVTTMSAQVATPIVLHLDHCKSFETIVRAIKAGFTSVMFDGSALPFEENLAETARVVRVAHAAGVGVEAELGALAKGAHSNEEEGEEIYTSPAEAERFVAETKVDALAVSIGTVHGMYKGTPKVDVGVLKKIAAVCPIPLVLHGGSGTPEQIILECITDGIAKINVNTEISMHALDLIRAHLGSGGETHLSQVGRLTVGAVKDVVGKYMGLFRNA